MTRANKPLRLLAVDPTTRGIAWALLEGTDTLVDWGTPIARPPKNERSLGLVTELLDLCRPDVLVLEELEKGPLRTERVQFLLEAIEEVARVPVRRISRRQAYAALGPEVRTKYQCALALVERFPALTPWMPHERKPWMSEDNRMNIFDALALATAASLIKRP
jgi:hypothetical protein